MKKTKPLPLVIAVLLLTATIVLTGCSLNATSDSYGYGSNEYDYSEDYNNNNEYQYFGSLGSASEMDGTTLVLSIFTDDENGVWDFDENKDLDLGVDMLEYLDIACNWLTKKAAKYDCDAEFIYDWSDDDNLIYYADIDGDLMNDEDNMDPLMWKYIEKNIDSEALMDEYGADNIIYMNFMRTPKSTEKTSCTRNYYKGMSYPYEVCFIYTQSEGEEECPAALAHEMLHTFGAPDLYMADTDGFNYGITKKYVKHCEEINSNDIMYYTYDLETNDAVYDRITNAFSQLDAYYTGLTDYSKEADKWGFKPSEHEQ